MSSQTRLFVGNLPDKTTEIDLHTAFAAYGEITHLDLKNKDTDEKQRNFAFITLSSSHNIESCINHFTNHPFKGKKLYVTRARESFLERLQRERQQEQANKDVKNKEQLPQHNPVINLSNKLNPRKRQVDFQMNAVVNNNKEKKQKSLNTTDSKKPGLDFSSTGGDMTAILETDAKKEHSDKKRMESIKRKRQEFKEKQSIIKTGLLGIDNVHNKKIVFSDDETHNRKTSFKDTGNVKKNKTLLDIDDSGDEINFDIKKQFEGRRGQKVLDLQSKYKSDKRFTLDERFIDDEQQDKIEDENIENNENEDIELGPENEKAKQLDILQDVLGVAIKRPAQESINNKQTKTKIGMLRFDPTQPEHAKFLAPVEQNEEAMKKSKKKKKDKQLDVTLDSQPEQPKPEVSKEQFYKVSETLKKAIAQPTSFSLRSLFGNNEEETKKDDMEQDTGFIPLDISKDHKKNVKNPLDLGEKNPFVYDSSDSEDEKKDEEIKHDPVPEKAEAQSVWKENLFFSKSDYRFKEGLEFFNQVSKTEVHKERRELKSLMKKRIYNKERKNQMFQKKIGGRKKTMKKSYRKKT